MSSSSTINGSSGYSPSSKTFHSLFPPIPLPSSPSQTLTSFILSSLPSPLPSTPAFISSTTNDSLSYPLLLSQFHSLSSHLPHLLSPGDTVLILSPPNLHIPLLILSLISFSAIPSPSNPLNTPSELLLHIHLSHPKLAFSISSLSQNLPFSLPTILIDSPFFLSLLHSPHPTPLKIPLFIPLSHPAAILYSSGTTGALKAVILTHQNFISLLSVLRSRALPRETPAVTLFTLPLFHVFGFFMMLRSVALGETGVFMERFEFSAALRAVEKYRVTFMPVSPPLVVKMLKDGEVERRDLSSLELIASGGAPLGREVVELFRARFPAIKIIQGYGLIILAAIKIIQGYGLTETAGGTTSPEENDVVGSVGRLSANMEARIVDPVSGEALPPGRQGELWLRGPTIMQGYIGDEEATTSTLNSDGWLKTGDICYFTEDGFLFIVDRLKELIKYKAYQVPPAELEHILNSHPEIIDAAVIPYPDEEAGEIPMAFIVRSPGSSLTEAAVQEFVAKQVAPYKKIRRVEFIDSIPKSAAGKILRRVLVDRAVSKTQSKL